MVYAAVFTEYEGNELLQRFVAEFSWSKHLAIMTKCKDIEKRQFYILSTKKYGWTKDVLIHKIEVKAFIICKFKKRTIVEYALKDSNQPIGIATYSLTTEFPESYQELLPDRDEIAEKLNLLMNE